MALNVNTYANSVMALIMNEYDGNSVMALISDNSVMALYDNSVKALMQIWLKCNGTGKWK